MVVVYKSQPSIGIWRVATSIDLEMEKEFIAKLEEKGIPYKVVKKIPSLRQLEKWSDDGVCPTPDGCRVEPDGHCEHGFPSWLLVMGFI